MASLTPSPKMQFFDANGNPLVGGKLYTYAAGTTSPLATYTDSSGTSANTNPIILDSRGEANVWLGVGSYKMILKDSVDALILTVDNILGVPSSNAALVALAASDGSSLVGFIQSGTGAVARTVQSKLRDTVSVKDFGADPLASAAVNAAAINAAIQANLDNEILITEAYVINAPINLNGFNGIIRFSSPKGKLLAGANNLKIFESTTNAYGARIIEARVDGNGFTGVTAFDLQRFQLRGAMLVRPVMLDCEYGIYLRSLCWGLKIDHPETNGVNYPITLAEGCNAVLIDHPSIDDFGVVGIWIKTGGAFPNVGNMILNGFVQNGSEGIVDQGIQTQVIGTYFEGCSASDIALKTDSGNFYGCATNHTATGNRAYRGESADAAMIVHPFMSNAARTIGLFDFDGACTNCYYDVIFGTGSRNLPLGTVTGIKQISNKPGPIGGVTRDDGKFSTLSSTGITEFATARTAESTQTIATATPTTYFTVAAGMYIAYAFIPFSGGPAQYTAQAFILCDGNGARVIANNGANLTITLSGLNVQVTQTSGGNQSVIVQWLRVA
jgi:hypothetical protein